jgi:hypothetical protein
MSVLSIFSIFGGFKAIQKRYELYTVRIEVPKTKYELDEDDLSHNRQLELYKQQLEAFNKENSKSIQQDEGIVKNTSRKSINTVRKVKKVYLGLPHHLVENVLWVAREFRTNQLSHEPGGSDVVVEYQDEKVYGYDWIKYPSRYVQKIWTEGISEVYEDYDEWEEDVQLDLIKREIRRIFARKYKKEEYDSEPFKEIWNSETSFENPWTLLKSYDISK